MSTLPACCTPTPNASRAERMFCAYNNSGPEDRRGLTYDNKEVPSWGVLQVRAHCGDVGSRGVIEKWEAVASAYLEEPAIPVSQDYLIEVCNALHAHGWIAEYEPGQQDDDEGPVRFVNGPLILGWMTFALSRHTGLGLSVYGLSGEWTSVDCIETPAAEVPGKIAGFARSVLPRDAERLNDAVQAAERLTPLTSS